MVEARKQVSKDPVIQAARVILMRPKMAAERSCPTAAQQQAGSSFGKRTGADRVKYPAQREDPRRVP
jgi:hypothetical protein